MNVGEQNLEEHRPQIRLGCVNPAGLGRFVVCVVRRTSETPGLADIHSSAHSGRYDCQCFIKVMQKFK